MAYKEESDQQFLESVLRQVRGPRRPMGNQQYDGVTGYGPDDDSFGHEKSPLKHGFQNLDRPENQDYNIDNFLNNHDQQSSQGDHHYDNIPDQEGEKENPQTQMSQIKKMIDAKEKELHELQQKKVELMRKITGRLESNNNLAFFKSWSEYQEGRDPNEPGSPEWIKAREEAHLAATKKRIPARLQSGINDHKKSKGDMLHRSVGQIAKMGNTSGG